LSTNIELVAFDLGNVLCTVDELSVSRQLSAICDKTPGKVHDIVFAQKHKQSFERGAQSFDEHAVKAIANLGIDMPLDVFTNLYDSVLIPSEDMFPLVETVAESRRIALVSNTSEPHWEWAKRTLPFSSKLDPVIVSYSVGSMKPEPAFYDALLQQSNVDPSKIFFIDDLAVNIDAARKAGMHGHQFTSQVTLEQELKRLSVI
jgi:putative hydrolase of the HAD superfamily